ncbi:MAG: hypothetical protein HY913_24350 [Desulfomonile tiedjei]|nr:hypothetical protein [Desulfomonile tiedjei]
MKKGLFLFIALLILTGAASVHAQGLLGYGLPGAPQFPASGAGAYGYSTTPFLAPPTFYIGWMESYKNTTFRFDGSNLGSARWPAAGLWLGLEEKINVSESCGVAVDGWILVPTNRRSGGAEPLTTVVFDTSGIPISTTTSLGSGTWDTRNDWWYVDAMGYCGCSKTFAVLAGFRYEHFSTRFRDPKAFEQITIDFNGGTATTSDPDAGADFTVNSYQPYVGVQYFLGGPTGSINIRLLGFPYVPADVNWLLTGGGASITSKGNLKDSYFFELFAQAERNIFGNANIGGFFRWNLLHGRTSLHTEVLPAIGSIDNVGSFDRNTLTFGGSFSLNFVTPY